MKSAAGTELRRAKKTRRGHPTDTMVPAAVCLSVAQRILLREHFYGKLRTQGRAPVSAG